MSRASFGLLVVLGALLVPATTVSVAAASEDPGDGSEGPPPAPWPRQKPLGEIPADRALRAGFLVIDGVYDTELTAPLDILHHTVFHTEPGIEVFTVSPYGRPVTSFEGLRIVPDHGFDNHPPIDILVVPSGEHNMDSDLENEELIRWVRETGQRALYVMSLCDGAFVLAEAGLLNGRHATTFPADQDRFEEMFRRVDLERDVSFVHDGPAVTSVGGARSFQPALYLVDLLYGVEVARAVAAGLVLPWPPRAQPFRALVVDYSKSDR